MFLREKCAKIRFYVFKCLSYIFFSLLVILISGFVYSLVASIKNLQKEKKHPVEPKTNK